MTILQDREKQVFSAGILRLVGYGLLLMAVVDLFFLVIPSQLMNPLWTFQTMGSIVERIPITLLGMVLVYCGVQSDRAPIETKILKFLSWFSLVAAIFLMLMIPLSIYNSWQIYNQHSATANAQFVSQKDLLQQFKAQLEAAKSKDEIGMILQQQANQKFNIPDSVNTQELKQSIIATLKNNQDSLTSQAQAFRAQKRSLLLKKCLKWNLGALIASILFFLIWKSTGWVRLMMVKNED
ncbi:MAG: HpsJ family protein [Cyanobacteria bacterium P01_E01_bin.35]